MSRLKRIITAKEKKAFKAEVDSIVKSRKFKGLTQAGLAKLMGVSTSNVSNIESGALIPTIAWTARAKAALNLKNTSLKLDKLEKEVKKTDAYKKEKMDKAEKVYDLLPVKYKNIFNKAMGALLGILEESK